MTEAETASSSLPVGDTPDDWPVESSDVVFSGPVVDVRRDRLVDRAGGTFERDVVVNKGAVAILAIDDDRVLVVHQYRRPAERRLVELPAGLLDVTAEQPLAAARRELVEEGHVEAERWSELLTLMPSPGTSDETITVFLAEGVRSAAPPAGFSAVHEEATMTRRWVPLADLVDAILAGRVTNAITVAGVLALWSRRHPRSP